MLKVNLFQLGYLTNSQPTALQQFYSLQLALAVEGSPQMLAESIWQFKPRSPSQMPQ